MPVVELDPVDGGPVPEGEECTEEHEVDAGEEAPCNGVLLPPSGPVSLAEYLEHQRRDYFGRPETPVLLGMDLLEVVHLRALLR